MLSLILSNRPYANEHVYILARPWRHRMVDDISGARAIRSRGMHDVGLGVKTIGDTFTNFVGSTDPQRNRHVEKPLEHEYDPEFCGYGAHTSPVSSDADTDSVSKLRFTPPVQTLPKASASMGGHRSPTPPTARWAWSKSSNGDDDNYRGVVGDCSDAVVRHVRRTTNTCCRAHVANEVRACFGVIMREAMEPAFLNDVVNDILQ